MNFETIQAQVKRLGRVGSWAPGGYMCKCVECGATFEGDKRARNCLPCAVEGERVAGREGQVKAGAARIEELHSALANLFAMVMGEVPSLLEGDHHYGMVKKALAGDGSTAAEVWKPTHRHLKTGGLYRVLMQGLSEADLEPVVIYETVEFEIWVRPAEEFFDGRFTALDRLDEENDPGRPLPKHGSGP